jgi:ribosomal protein L31
MSEHQLTPNMKKKIKRGTLHPHFGPVTVTRTDGRTETVFTALGKKFNQKLVLDIDSLKHPAWTKNFGDVDKTAKVINAFLNRYGDDI